MDLPLQIPEGAIVRVFTYFTADSEAAFADPLEFTTTIQSDVLASAIHLGLQARKWMNYQAQWINAWDISWINILMDNDEVCEDAMGDYKNAAQYKGSLHPGFIHVPPEYKWSEFAIMDVVLKYLGGKRLPENPSYQDRGIPHTDVVDVLDGMMCRGHMTEMQATDLLLNVMSFEYDFDAPVDCT